MGGVGGRGEGRGEEEIVALLVVAAAAGSGKYSVVSGVGGGVPNVPPST